MNINVRRKDSRMKRLIIVVAALAFIGISAASSQSVAAATVSDTPAAAVDNGINKEQYAVNIARATPITLDQYLTKISQGDKFIVYVGFSDCPHCRKFSPVLKQFLEQSSLPVVYLDYGPGGSFKTAPQDQISKFYNSFSNGFEFMGTPTVAVFNHGKIVSMTVGDDTTLNDLEHIQADYEQIQ
jgi:predicted bacteriocin transport accessory protein